MAVYFYYGEEDYNMELEIEKLKANLNPDFLSMSYQVLDSPEYPVLINALRTPPMMFGEMLTVINVYKYFFRADNKEIKFEDSELDDIEDALKNNPEGLNVVFVLKLPRGENKKPDARRKIFKILSKFNTQIFNTFSTLYTDEIVKWVQKRAKEKDLIIDRETAELLVERNGNNLRLFDVELDKLKLVAYPQKSIKREMVEEIGISNQDVFNVTKAIMQNRRDIALLEYKKLLDKKHPLEIISVIQTMLRQWIIVKSSSSMDEIMKMTGIHNENRIGYMKKDLKNVSLKDLVKLKNNLFDIEYRLKAGEIVDVSSEVECALIR